MIDHKSSSLGFDEWQKIANIYTVQLDAYARAVDLSSDKRAIEKWLFLPVAGGEIKME